eukprot:361758-Chlamydomonas_euryale.AAC.5
MLELDRLTASCALSSRIPCYVNHALLNQQPIYQQTTHLPAAGLQVERNGAERSEMERIGVDRSGTQRSAV